MGLTGNFSEATFMLGWAFGRRTFHSHVLTLEIYVLLQVTPINSLTLWTVCGGIVSLACGCPLYLP